LIVEMQKQFEVLQNGQRGGKFEKERKGKEREKKKKVEEK